MKIRENGNRDNGWLDTPFWWPVLMNVADTETVVFVEDTI